MSRRRTCTVGLGYLGQKKNKENGGSGREERRYTRANKTCMDESGTVRDGMKARSGLRDVEGVSNKGNR